MSRPEIAALRARVASLAVALLAVALLASVPAGADTHPNLARGFSADKAFQVGDLDHVNGFSGALTLTLPITTGPLHVDGDLDISLAVVFSSNPWNFVEREPIPGLTYLRAEENARSTAGFGWSLSPGRLECPTCAPNTSGRWLYIAPDQSEHAFYMTPSGSEVPDPDSGVWYTRSGDFLRLREVTAGQQVIAYDVDMPNGEIHRFGPDLHADAELQIASDRFGNYVSVLRGQQANGDPRWVIRDSHENRAQVVNFEPDPLFGWRVGNVVLTGFGGATATFTFGYTEMTLDRPCHDTDPETQPFDVHMLTSITIEADQSTYQVPEYYTSTSTGCRSVGSPKSLTTRTLSKVSWSYQDYTFPNGQRVGRDYSNGVASRTLHSATGAVGEWVYTTQLNGLVELLNTTTTPLGHKTERFFSVSKVTSGPWQIEEYGLPLTRNVADATGTRHLSSREYGAGNALLRSSFVRYERDAGGPAAEVTEATQRNQRQASSRTVYDDDTGCGGAKCFADTDSSGWTGLGRHRTVTTGGNLAAGNQRSSYTSFYHPDDTDPSALIAIPPDKPWLLAMFDLADETENGVTARRTQVVDPATGWVSRTRVHTLGPDGVGALGESTNDVVVERLEDGKGNLSSERWYGGDVQGNEEPLGTGPLADLSLPQPPDYRIDSSYAHGTLQTQTYVNAAGAPLSFKTVDQTIDPSTGLVSSSRDSSLIQTAFEYDALGRLRWVKPQSGHDGWTEYVYTRATGANALALVQVFHRPNGGGTALAESSFRLDAFGRIWREQRKMHDGTFSTRETLYDAMGHRRSVSELGNTAKLTEYLDLDPYGRPGRVVPPDRPPPDGTAHQVVFAYKGVREVARKVQVADSAAGENPAWTTEIYDRQGRLHQLKEEAEVNFANTTTTYSYDVGSRLRHVQQATTAGTQNRFFTYDRRGFLLEERHPEKGGASGNGIVFYSDYDARGHAGRRYECAAATCVNQPSQRVAHLTFDYDRAERLTGVTDVTSSPGKELKGFVYGTSNAVGVRTNGRLLTATRYNYQLVETTAFTIKIDETYAYGGRGGRPSSRSTQVTSWTAANPTPVAGEGFSQGWVYDELGNVKDTTYPLCTAGGCEDLDSPRTVTNSFANGWLSAVTGSGEASYASAITYHSNGMVKQIARSNGVTLDVGRDPNFMPRPASFATSGAPLNWSSGAYEYDGAGNVTGIGASRFTYDHVSRLVTADLVVEAPSPGLPFADGFETGDFTCWAPSTCLSGGQTGSQAYTYDPFGNLNAIAGTPGRSTPTDADTNRLEAASYDVAGNLLSWNDDSYEYDALGVVTRRCPAGCTKGAADWRHIYTADDERLWATEVEGGSGNLWTVRDLGGLALREYDALAAWAARDYVYREGQLLATNFPGEGDRHFHLDHLGTPRLITDGMGGMVAYHAYFPFGEEATPAAQDAERRKFTGHERDTLSTSSVDDDRDYMHRRFYSPLTARFLSVDPVGGRPSIPQAWNRYSYTRGNPLKFIDPNGKDVMLVVRNSTDGRRTNFGHVALRVFGKGYDFTYDFGRYGRVSATRLSGEGILRVWRNFGAFVAGQRGHGDLKGVHYQTTPEVDQEIMGFYADLIKEGKQTRKTANYTEYKLQQDYDLFDHNCTTICMDALEHAEQEVGVGFQGLGSIKHEGNPLDLYDELESIFGESYVRSNSFFNNLVPRN